MRQPLISVRDLRTYFYTNERCNKVLNGVSFDVKKGKTLCVVGESGCGKSVTALSIMRLLPPLARIESGAIMLHGANGDLRLERLPQYGRVLRNLRGSEIAMIFQDPMVALNPVYSIGFQIGENLRWHTKISRKQARKKAIDLLNEMGIPQAAQRVDEYPHQFSGGMRQRAMIALAMACNPKVLIADEPTTALDVTVQAQIFELMGKLKTEHDTAIMLITHDMGVVTEMADEVIVMYMGTIVESGTVADVLRKPSHPYTKALLRSIPVIGKGKDQVIESIRGRTPDPYNRPAGCQFAPRCEDATEKCREAPGNTVISPTHSVKCWYCERTVTHDE